ncbi:MAG: energy transducer TonB [Saprospiraceae bacterium]|nr:energy transducer TonB [Saprospiraceae bacterium]
MRFILIMSFCLLTPLMINGQDEKDNVETIFTTAEVMPRFPGCEDESRTNDEKEACAKNKMLAYINDNLSYPDKAKIFKIRGVVVTQFVVNENGGIENARVIRAIGYGCDEEALRLVKSMNDMEEPWVPGRQRGEVIKLLYTLPVRFNPDF